jgi:hypothetical protein
MGLHAGRPPLVSFFIIFLALVSIQGPVRAGLRLTP